MILTTRQMFPSARALRALINPRMLITTNPAKLRAGKHIRWGTTAYSERETINPAVLVNVCASKLETSFTFNGKVPTPIYTRGVLDFPFIARTTMTSFGGRGIHVVRSETDIPNQPYWATPFQKMQSELRVHVVGGVAKKAFKKIANGEEEEYPIRNMSRGYHFSRIDVPPRCAEFSLSVWSILQQGLNIEHGFYAMDVGWISGRNGNSGYYFLIELNSAPGITENDDTASIYANYLKEVM